MNYQLFMKLTKYLKIILILSGIFFIILVFSNTYAQKQNSTGNTTDSSKVNTSQNNLQTDSAKNIQLQIDTSKNEIIPDTSLKSNSTIIDSLYQTIKEKDNLTNTKLLLYIFLTIIGLFLFFFLFIQTLFKVFHKNRSTRQSLLLCWNLFFLVSLFWIFIVWGILAGLWNSGAFIVVIIFLIIISLIMLLTAIKSK